MQCHTLAVTPTRRFAATSPLKGEVESPPPATAAASAAAGEAAAA